MTTITIVDEMEIDNIEHHYTSTVEETPTGAMVSVPKRYAGYEVMVIVLQKDPRHKMVECIFDEKKKKRKK